MKTILKIMNKFLCNFNYKIDYANFLEHKSLDKDFSIMFSKQEKFGWTSAGPKIHRLFKLYEILKTSKKVKGQILEFGCYKGSSALIILETLKILKLKKKLFLYDSFNGLVNITSKDKLKKNNNFFFKTGDFSASINELEKNLINYKNKFEIIQGTLPQDCKLIPKSKLSFIHIDLDLYLPTKIALEMTFKNLNKGGFVVFDDYGCLETPGTKIAVDEYVKNNNLDLVTLPYGQAFIQKN